MENIPQETTSTYFSGIIRHGVLPINIHDLDPNVVDNFNHQISLAFPDEAELVRQRVYYLIPYILQNIDWDEYRQPLEEWQLLYYYRRERFLKKTRITEEAFYDHVPLQSSILALGLDPAPVFEFILFLRYYYMLRSNLRYSCVEQLDNIVTLLNDADKDTISLDLNIDGKHIKLNNGGFIRKMFASINREALSKGNFVDDFDQGSVRDKVRALDYYMLKTLLDYLPIDRSIRRGGKFSQAERNFGLSVLSLCGRLPDIDREGECSQENNATFDKLMRDFAGVPIPFAMELFL